MKFGDEGIRDNMFQRPKREQYKKQDIKHEGNTKLWKVLPVLRSVDGRASSTVWSFETEMKLKSDCMCFVAEATTTRGRRGNESTKHFDTGGSFSNDGCGLATCTSFDF